MIVLSVSLTEIQKPRSIYIEHTNPLEVKLLSVIDHDRHWPCSVLKLQLCLKRRSLTL